MRKILIFSLLFTIFLIPNSFAEWFFDAEDVYVNVDMISYAEVVPLKKDGFIETATVNMTFFPQNFETQKLLTFTTNPSVNLDKRIASFVWNKPYGRIDFGINSDIRSSFNFVKIEEKIDFPITFLPRHIRVYTEPSPTIDSDDDEIIRIASELVKGEDDLYKAVFKIADWTNSNIDYNLSSLTAEVSQKASWVLEERKGVCDELTSLFIAMLRAVGIPAKFVSGISYTNSPLFPDSWGAHGWAEVYFPGHGWVPFDVTYGEFGWVDATHIKFKESVDSDEASTYYQWLGKDADVKTKKIDIETKLIKFEGNSTIPIKVTGNVLKDSVKFGSNNLFQINLENPNDFYYATELSFSKPEEVKVLGERRQSFLLGPGEKKKLFWILKVDNELNREFIYTFPLSIRILDNVLFSSEFKSNIRSRFVSFQEVNDIARLLKEEEEKEYSANVMLDCSSDKEEFYEYEDVKVVCNIKNIGNVFLEDVEICFEGDCNSIDIGIAQEKYLSFTGNKSTGYRESAVSLQSKLVSKVDTLPIVVKDRPLVKIEEIGFPSTVSYDDKINISYLISKESDSYPQDLIVTFSYNGRDEVWEISELDDDKKFVLEMVGSQLTFGSNDFEILVEYSDELGKKYDVKEDFTIEFNEANIWQRVVLFFNRFGWF